MLATSLTAFAQDTTGTGSLVGVVTNDTGAPEPFTTVCLVASNRCVVTAADGAFRLDRLRAGEYRLEISAPGRPAIVSVAIEVRAGVDRRVEVTAPRSEAFESTVTVVATMATAPEEVKGSAFLIAPREILRSAGAEQDVSRYVQALPGAVIGTNDFRNDIIVRGGSPLENLFVVDNVEVPNINAFANFASAGGSVSILDALLIRDVTFLTGGYPAPYVNRVSSVLQIALREGSRERFQGRATVGFAGAGAVLEGPIGRSGSEPARGSWIVSARRSFLDFFTRDLGFGGVPVQYTYNAKVLYDLGSLDRVWFVNLSGVDRIRLGLTSDTPVSDELSNFDIRYRGWRSASGVNWQHLFKAGAVGLLGVTRSDAVVRSTTKDLIRNGIPSIDRTVDDVIAGGQLVFGEDSRESETTAKYDLTAVMGQSMKLQAGGTVKLFQTSYTTQSPYGSENPYAVTPGLDVFDLDRRLTTTQWGTYFQATRDLTRRLNVTAGARVDGYAFVDATRVSPRTGVSYVVGDGWRLKGSYGRYYQLPPYLFLAAFPRNRELPPLRADHFVAGVERRVGGARLSAEVYRKHYSDYPAAADYPQLSLANLGDTFNVREVLFPLVGAGRGRASGVELVAEQKSRDRWFGELNLSLARSRHAGRDGILRPGAFDYPVVFNANAGWAFTRKWSASARITWLAGRPYTPFDEALSSAQRRPISDLSRVNAERAPGYFRLDLRADRTWRIGGRDVLLFAGVQNATNRRNFSGYRWNRRTGQTTFDDQLGIFPLVGLDWKF